MRSYQRGPLVVYSWLELGREGAEKAFGANSAEGDCCWAGSVEEDAGRGPRGCC